MLLAHYSIRTPDLEASTRFYEDVLGLHKGPRPAFKFPGVWLYSFEATEPYGLVHLVGVSDETDDQLSDYLGDTGENLTGSGAIDHIAFFARDEKAMISRLEALRIDYRRREVPDLALVQLFVDDPNGITIELNYATDDATS